MRKRWFDLLLVFALVFAMSLSVYGMYQFSKDASDNEPTARGTTHFGAVSFGGEIAVDGSSDTAQLSVQGYTTQTSNLLVLEQSDGTDVVTATNAGALYLASLLDVDGAASFNSTADVNGNELTLDADADTSVTSDTDDQIDWEIGGQDMISFTQSASYYTMAVYDRVPSLIKTASYTATTQESGALFSNKGAAAEVTLTLPAATSGLDYCFYVYAAVTVTIKPDASDTIHHLTNSAGDRLQNTGTPGDSVCLTAIDGADWVPTQEEGTWSDVD